MLSNIATIQDLVSRRFPTPRDTASLFATALESGDPSGVAKLLHPTVELVFRQASPAAVTGEYLVVTALSRLAIASATPRPSDAADPSDQVIVDVDSRAHGRSTMASLCLRVDELGMVDRIDVGN